MLSPVRRLGLLGEEAFSGSHVWGTLLSPGACECSLISGPSKCEGRGAELFQGSTNKWLDLLRIPPLTGRTFPEFSTSWGRGLHGMPPLLGGAFRVCHQGRGFLKIPPGVWPPPGTRGASLWLHPRAFLGFPHLAVTLTPTLVSGPPRLPATSLKPWAVPSHPAGT